jgi:hypothetical protein
MWGNCLDSCQERAQKRADPLKVRGISSILERLIGCQKWLRSMYFVINMRYQTSIFWNAARRTLVVGYRIVKQAHPSHVSRVQFLFGCSETSVNTKLRRTIRAVPRHVGAPGRLIIRLPFKPIFFKLFRPRKGLANSSEVVCPNCGIFSDKLFCLWKPEFISTILPIIPVTS